jgi:hypothetical protein
MPPGPPWRELPLTWPCGLVALGTSPVTSGFGEPIWGCIERIQEDRSLSISGCLSTVFPLMFLF